MTVLPVEEQVAHAIRDIRPTSLAHEQPMTASYEDCFEWQEVADILRETLGGGTLPGTDACTDGLTLYAVVFRSIRKPEADTESLYAADRAAHIEASSAGGLLMYWYGTLNCRRECLATCVWRSREDAIKALHKPAHLKAMSLTKEMYITYRLERLWVRYEDGKFSFEPV